MKHAILLATTLAVAIPTHAQLSRLTNPTVTVKIEHPPGVVVPLERVAFAPPEGPCGDEFVAGIERMVFARDVEIVDRLNLDALLAEHDFSASDYANPSAVAVMGEVLGPTVLIAIRLHACDVKQEHLYDRRSRATIFISRTTAYLKGVLKAIDLATSRIVANQALDETRSLENKSYDGYPEYPSDYDIKNVVMNQAASDIAHLFFAWTQTRELVFFNDEKCGLKTAYRHLRAGSTDLALSTSLTNAQECQGTNVKPKTRARALYNVGMMHFIAHEHEQAIEYFQQAVQVRPGTVMQEALAESRRALTLAEEKERTEVQMLELAGREEERRRALLQERAKEAAREEEEGSVEAQLLKLKDLLDRGLISQSVYDQQAAEILKGGNE